MTTQSCLQVSDEGQSLPCEGFTAFPEALPRVHLLPAMLSGGVVEHLRWRLEPPAEAIVHSQGEPGYETDSPLKIA